MILIFVVFLWWVIIDMIRKCLLVFVCVMVSKDILLLFFWNERMILVLLFLWIEGGFLKNIRIRNWDLRGYLVGRWWWRGCWGSCGRRICLFLRIGWIRGSFIFLMWSRWLSWLGVSLFGLSRLWVGFKFWFGIYWVGELVMVLLILICVCL